MAGPLEDRVAAVTGASSGIGAATALALSQAGAAVAIGARRADRLRELSERLEKPCVVREVDVTDGSRPTHSSGPHTTSSADCTSS